MLARQFDSMFTVYGGMYGSEGKGQIVRYIAGKLVKESPKGILAYRIGGPNAGHTFYVDDNKIVTCQIPGPMFLDNGIVGVIGPEGVISCEVLADELTNLAAKNKKYQPGTGPQTLLIDRSSIVITKDQHDRESGLVKKIGSTGKGVGAATSDKVMRFAVTAEHSLLLAAFIDDFKDDFNIIICDTIDMAKTLSNPNSLQVVIEGTQGAGLSLHTSGYYPYCTSRECTPQGIWAGCGLHPKMAIYSESVMVLRTYPIRVAGPSGPMTNETDWETISKRAGRTVQEITTVTKNVRRVSEINFEELLRTTGYTRPDVLALTFLDYIDPNVYKIDPIESRLCRDFVNKVEDTLETPVKYVGTGEGCVFEWIH